MTNEDYIPESLDYQSPVVLESGSSWFSYNVLVILLAVVATGLFYKFKQSKNEDEDEFIKPVSGSSSTTASGSYSNNFSNAFNQPFRRNRDDHDDFDRQV